MNAKELMEFAKKASVHKDISRVSAPVQCTMPRYDLVTRTSSPCAAWVCSVQQGYRFYTVVIAYTAEQFMFWCGDKFLEGRLTQEDARERCEEAAKSMPGASKKVVEKMMSMYCALPRQDDMDCNFWQSWRNNREPCEHINAVLHTLEKMGDFTTPLVQRLEGSQELQQDESSLNSFLDALAFRVPVLLEGDRGAGKTHTARMFARKRSHDLVEMGGNEGIEATDMLGYLVPAPEGGMVWLDGALTEAFRRARTGKTVLLIDELLRIRQRELSILLTALSPDNGIYRLRTGRIKSVADGVAVQEVLECPCENLFVIATTNVGCEYAVDEIDEALAERFVPLRMETTSAGLTRILTDVGSSRGFSAKLVAHCVRFFEKMRELKARGVIRAIPSSRTMARALELSDSEQDVPDWLQAHYLLWVARDSDGSPVEEQVETVTQLVGRCFNKEK